MLFNFYWQNLCPPPSEDWQNLSPPSNHWQNPDPPIIIFSKLIYVCSITFNIWPILFFGIISICQNLDTPPPPPSKNDKIWAHPKASTLPMFSEWSLRQYSTIFCWVIEYNRRLYSQGGLTRNDHGFEHSICASRGQAASKRIEQICRCPGDTVKCLQIVF